MDGQSDVIQVAAVGRPFGLGMLYDCRTETLVPGITLWDRETLKKNLDSRAQQNSDYEIITSDSINDKAMSLDISGGLKLGFLAGLVKVSGSAKYLKDRTSSSHQERVTLNYKCTTKFEQLTMSQLGKGNFQHPDIFDSGDATHVVTGIEYGGNAFLVFDKQHTESKSKKDIRGSVHAHVKLIPKFQFGADADSASSKEHEEQTDSLSVRFYGDCIPSTNPSTYDEAVHLCKKLPELFGKEGENAVPKNVWLYPLCKLDSKAAKLVREISANLVNSATEVIEQLHELEIKCNDILKTPACDKFLGLRREVEIFQKMIDVYKIDFQKQLLHVLPKIRGGGAEESELANILKERECSPFKEQGLYQWLEQKQSEGKVLNQYVQSMGDIPFAETGDLEAECMNPANKHVICFTILRLSKDSYLSAMKEYSEKVCVKIEQKLPSKNSQFQSKSGLSMIHNARIFTNFKSEFNFPVKTKFMIVEDETDSEPGGYIYLYRNGRLNDRNFIPPSEPRRLAVTDIKHDSLTLTWQKPEQGDHNVTEYEIKYRYQQNGISEKMSTRVEKCEHFAINNLLPYTEYSLQVRSYSVASISKFTKEVKACTLPTSPPGKCLTKQTSLTTARLEWSKPAVIGTNVSIESYTVQAQKNDSTKTWEIFDHVDGDRFCTELAINQDVTYKFRMIADCGESGSSLPGPQSDEFCVKRNRSQFDKIIDRSNLISPGKPAIYQMFTSDALNDQKENFKRFEFGHKRENAAQEKVILFIGAKGSGKSTLINGLVNYIFGVEWVDDVRFKLTVRSDSGNQSSINCYTIHHENNYKISFSVTIIDMPGFVEPIDQKGMEMFAEQVLNFFTTAGKCGIDHIDALCVVMQSSLSHMTESYLWIFDSIISTFRECNADGIFSLLTFADGQTPPVLESLVKTNLPSKKYFKFNNSALFACKENTVGSIVDGSFDEIFWKMGSKGFSSFVNELFGHCKKFAPDLNMVKLQCPSFHKVDLSRSVLLRNVKPRIYQLLTNEVFTNCTDKIRKCEFGIRGEKKVSEKVIMLVGATGSGKTTLINAMINYVLGVKWEDDCRFKLIEETERANQAVVETSWITAYTIHHREEYQIPYTLTIIDTPGFGDVAGIMKDKQITERFRTYFNTSSDKGIDHIDAVGFVVDAGFVRLTHTQRYIFDCILSLFGKDMQDNIFMLLTFADAHEPYALGAIKAANLPYNNYFTFNNSALFTKYDDRFGAMYFQMSSESFESFLKNYLPTVKSQSLTLTKEGVKRKASDRRSICSQ